MATARGASAATGQMVICTGTGPVVVYIDDEGQPTAAPHICPDCVLAFHTPPDRMAVAHPAAFRLETWHAPHFDRALAGPRGLGFQPRAPPLVF